MGKNNKNIPRNPMTNTKSMSREGMKIMRDIAHSKFNFYTEGHIFRNRDFTCATIMEINKRIEDISIHLWGLNTLISNGATDPKIINLMNRDAKSLEAYKLMYESLYSVYSTGDTGFLLALINKLPQYKYNI